MVGKGMGESGESRRPSVLSPWMYKMFGRVGRGLREDKGLAHPGQAAAARHTAANARGEQRIVLLSWGVVGVEGEKRSVMDCEYFKRL